MTFWLSEHNTNNKVIYRYSGPGTRMESVTFVYALATEQERQAEALKNKTQNQLERYRHVIQRQKEKERAFLSFKKLEFLSRQETKLHASRPHSAWARMSDRLPEVNTKGQEVSQKSGLLAARNETRSSPPFLNRRKTHLGTRYLSSNSTNSSSAETRKPSLSKGAMPELASQTSSSGNLVRSRATRTNNNHKARKGVHFEGETKVTTRPVKHNYKIVEKVTDSQKEVELKTFEKRGLNLPKWERVRVTKSKREKVSTEDCNNQEKAGNPVQTSNKSHNLQSVETGEKIVTKEPGKVSWAVVARLIGLKLKFKRRQVHGIFQAPELEVLDPTLNNKKRVGQETYSDPLEGVKDCRYLRMPNNK